MSGTEVEGKGVEDQWTEREAVVETGSEMNDELLAVYLNGRPTSLYIYERC